MADNEMFGDSVYQGGDAVDDTDDLDPVENLTGNDPDEMMQTGYNPPDREPYNLRRVPTPFEERQGESLDQQLAEEEPEVWDNAEEDVEGEQRAGRLVGSDEGSHLVTDSVVADDVGPAGYGSSAEEAAVHIVSDDREV